MIDIEKEVFTKSVKTKREGVELVFELNMNNGQLDISASEDNKELCISLRFVDVVRLKNLLNQNLL